VTHLADKGSRAVPLLAAHGKNMRNGELYAFAIDAIAGAE
jgi:hypothetical protein